jgi:hypothetical protein
VGSVTRDALCLGIKRNLGAKASISQLLRAAPSATRRQVPFEYKGSISVLERWGIGWYYILPLLLLFAGI